MGQVTQPSQTYVKGSSRFIQPSVKSHANLYRSGAKLASASNIHSMHSSKLSRKEIRGVYKSEDKYASKAMKR